MTDGRLGLEALDLLRERGGTPSGPQVPAFDPRRLGIGIVHLGIGAFHRAHQAVYTEDACAATGDLRWGILGVTQRSRNVADQLGPQDGLYGVLEKGASRTELRIISAVRDVAFPAEETARVVAAIAAPTTHIVSLTVTEKGYRADADGRLVVDEDVKVDVRLLAEVARGDRTDRAARTPIGLLALGLLARSSAAPPAGGITVVCCDNMPDNGAVVAGLVGEMLDRAGLADDPARRWIEAHVAFPSTMVDRIAPAATDDDRAEAEGILGLRDEGLVVAEPFRQWVIEDRFAGPRPAWEQAGAILTDDVAPYERAKLRVLNGAHSLLAYLGSLADHELIADAVADPWVGGEARAFLADDVLPTLTAPDGVDLAAYAESVLERFANPHTRHTTIQVAMDGSHKMPIRVLGTIADRLGDGALPRHAARALAAWIVFVARGRSRAGRALVLDDPRADELAAATGRGGAEPLPPARIVSNVLAIDGIVPEHVAAHAGFVALLEREVEELTAWLDGGSVPAPDAGAPVPERSQR
ncbi:MAG: mannitol dehydrogenase family protein [Microbacterium sp.]